MAPVKIQGLVQIRSKNRNRHTRASRWKEAVIEIVERKQKVTMVFSFKLEKRKRVFQLGNNVAGVVVSCCEMGLHCLYLTLKGDTSLLIDKLSSEDIEQLKAFLDLAHLSDAQDLDEPNSSHDFLESGHAFCRKYQDPVCGSLNTQERETQLPMKAPLSMSKSTSRYVKKERAEKEIKKRKRMPTPSVEISEEVLTEYDPEPQKKYKICTPRNKRGKGEKPMASREQEKHNWKLENSLISNVRRKINLDDTILPTQTLCDERSKLSQETPTCNEIQFPLDTYAKQLNREGFPNLGNTCYMNSILQSVFGIPTFAKDLLTQGIPWENVSCDDLIKPLSQLLVLKDIRDVEIKGQLLMTVKKSISTVADTFLGDEQNDAHEFLSQCLEQLKLNMEKINAMWNPEGENEGAMGKRFICPVAANFEMELHSSIVCEGCGAATINTEVSNYLSVDLHQGTKDHPLSIQKSLDLFFTPEKIEHNCENCKNKNSVLRYTWRRLPRVLIVHLKRYHFTSNRMLVKSQQPVEISKYLSVSSHCNENTKPPFPLTSRGPNDDYDVPDVSDGMMHEIFGQSISSMQPTAVSIDFTVLQVGSNEDDEVQNFQIMCDDQQQIGLESVSRIDPELLKTEKWMLCENVSPTWDSIICEPISIQDLGLRETTLQKLPENPEVKNYKKINVYGNTSHHTIIEICNNFCDLKEQKILEDTQEIGQQFFQQHGKRIQKEFLSRASPQSVGGTQEDAEKDLSMSSEMADQRNYVDFLGASGHPENIKVVGIDNPDAIDELKGMEDDPQNYRLVGVVSHFGSSQDSGHYVSDVYDFQRQTWLLYSDVQVFEIPEALIQENRLHTGYIFFYMRNDIFEWLLKKASECRLMSTSKDEKKTMDLFSSLLNGFTYLLEES
ncbi:ubiquitin carboxyl-terminal hydrolase 29 [Phodopus roborovskii]|uniref:Ubiquitin carboxyl-terminal hydrolase n=1 Tax=Phodopus roborovskii TaxID=109678 RepID=A0AAV0AAP3_PHORO|nr:ubiquitin carboxyl-terminal hydrolase 29 [Phodopus roborovskii]CAH7402101.1 Usp29 [Phodopus roborovskii]